MLKHNTDDCFISKFVLSALLSYSCGVQLLVCKLSGVILDKILLEGLCNNCGQFSLLLKQVNTSKQVIIRYLWDNILSNFNLNR